MSFKRFDTEDLVISADSVVIPAWSTGGATLTTFYSSSIQLAASSGAYYLEVYQTGSTQTSAEVQFSIAYGNKLGSGSIPYNSGVVGKSPSSTVYGQYRTLLLGDEDTNFLFNGVESTKGVYFINVNRSRYKEKLKAGSISLTVDGKVLTDDSNTATTVSFSDAGRVYNMVSGSTVYGRFYPDAGVVALSGTALGGNVDPTVTNTDNTVNTKKLFQYITSFILSSEETITSNYVFVRTRNSEFNYTSNPSAITGSGELRHSLMINNPQTYITTVGLYNDNNDLLAVAKLSSPLLKDFTKENLLRIKLDF